MTRAGSVIAGRSLAHTASGDSRIPIVFPRLFDILAWPSSPMIRLAAVSNGFGSGRMSLSVTEFRVPPAGNLAGQLEMLHLVFADRDQIGLVQQDIGRHQDRVVQSPAGMLSKRCDLSLNCVIRSSSPSGVTVFNSHWSSACSGT